MLKNKMFFFLKLRFLRKSIPTRHIKYKVIELPPSKKRSSANKLTSTIIEKVSKTD